MNVTCRGAAALALCTLVACSSSDSKPAPVVPGNQPPIAQAGFDRSVGKNAVVTLDGSASVDPEGFPIAHLWTMVSRPAGSSARLQSPTSDVTQFTADVPGAYVVRLQVSDGVNSPVNDEVTITCENQAPVASAGADREGSRGLELSLSASGSYDPDGDPLVLGWTLVTRPIGSAAALSAQATATTSLTPDVFGTYVVRLTVSDGVVSSFDDVTITVRNHAPVANAGPDLESNDGATLALSAAASSDPDGDALTCAWTLTARPTGSAAVLSDPTACAPTVTFDAEGVYAFSLLVSDGSLQSAAADAVQVTVHKKVWLLGHSVVDAEYSRSLDRVVTVGTTPNRLYVADPVAGTEQSVDLSLAPTAVSVSPDGLHAAVGHNGYVSYVRLSPAPLAVEKVIPTTSDVFDVVLAGNGFVYAFPRVDQWVEIHCLNVSTGAETLSSSWSIRAGTKAKLHPGGTFIYGADNGLSPADIEKYDIAAGTAKYLYDSPYHGDYAMCGDLWISEDGLRIFTACGNSFHSNTTTGSTSGADMTYAGALEATTRVRWVDHSLAAGQVLAIPAVDSWTYPPQPAGDTELRVFGDDFLARQDTVAFPRVGVGGKGFLAHGRFAFFSRDGTRRFVLFEVDASSGLLAPYGVVAY
ncbi:PKD domain-containing protein [Anaeromyxobacter sp. SG64]|uniref:PKD domain-containing protein n=1 Tax=Anaeromyxobacter sp. SG64 TaxID=2925409 RepID=UPI001F5739D9|nr:PKD domain-containing protein [Anaeromyxobacter sp. SG64]